MFKHLIPKKKESSPTTFALENLLTLNDSQAAITEMPSGDPNGLGHNCEVKHLPYCPIFLIRELENGGKERACTISGSIKDIPEYIELLDLLQAMTEKDILHLLIDSPGGYVTTGTAICSLIDICKGKVITHAISMCASAGSLIWSAGHECRAGNYALFMYHMSSHMDFGNSLAIKNNAAHCVDYVIRCLRMSAVKKGHITEEELNVLATTQRNVWIDAKTMQERLQSPPIEVTEPTDVEDVPHE